MNKLFLLILTIKKGINNAVFQEQKVSFYYLDLYNIFVHQLFFILEKLDLTSFSLDSKTG